MTERNESSPPVNEKPRPEQPHEPSVDEVATQASDQHHGTEKEQHLESFDPTSNVQKAPEATEVEQRIGIFQRLKLAIQLQKTVSRAAQQDEIALKIEENIIRSMEQTMVPEPLIQRFRDGLGKQRQSQGQGRQVDAYIMSGMLIYCGIIFAILVTLGIPDIPIRVAWVAFTISLPATAGYVLIQFSRKNNNLLNSGRIHGILALLAEIGMVGATAGIFFHVWVAIGWIFLLWSFVIFVGYNVDQLRIYGVPFLSAFKDILQFISTQQPARNKDE